MQVGYGAVGTVPAGDRGRYEGWLGRGGVAQLAAVLPAWAAGAHLPPEGFHAEVFGTDGRGGLARHAQAVGRALATEPDRPAAAAEAARHFGALAALAWPDTLGRVMAGAAAQAGTPAVQDMVARVAARRSTPARSGAAAGAQAGRAAPHGAGHAAPAKGARKPPTAEEIHRQNVEDLTRVLYQEARGEGRLAMEAVGWTLRNRMLRNGVANVHEAWGGYSHGVPHPTEKGDRAALAEVRRVAEGVLDGTVKDPTNGATHYYSPQKMPNETEAVGSASVGGGLEDVPGVLDRKGISHVQNFRPKFSTVFPQMQVPGIEERKYKFYRQPESGSRVR